MANALPQAIGAQLATPGRQVISMSGDGGIAMLMGDLLTLRQLSLPVKVIVFNNAALAFVQLEMRATGFLDRGVVLTDPGFAGIANAAGILGERVQTPHELARAIERALAHGGPALLDVAIQGRS